MLRFCYATIEAEGLARISTSSWAKSLSFRGSICWRNRWNPIQCSLLYVPIPTTKELGADLLLASLKWATYHHITAQGSVEYMYLELGFQLEQWDIHRHHLCWCLPLAHQISSLLKEQDSHLTLWKRWQRNLANRRMWTDVMYIFGSWSRVSLGFVVCKRCCYLTSGLKQKHNQILRNIKKSDICMNSL